VWDRAPSAAPSPAATRLQEACTWPLRQPPRPACVERRGALRAQRLLDKHLATLLADAPRRSVLFVDSSKVGADGGCGPPSLGARRSGPHMGTVCQCDPGVQALAGSSAAKACSAGARRRGLRAAAGNLPWVACRRTGWHTAFLS